MYGKPDRTFQVPAGLGLRMLVPAVMVAVVCQGCALAENVGDYPGVDVRTYASSGTGTKEDPWVNALRNAYAEKGDYHRYHMPAGYYQDSSTCDLQAKRITIEGDGPQLTWWYYENDDDSPCLRLSGDGRMMPYNTIRGICFEGKDKATGAAIEFIAQQYLFIDNVDIRHFRAGAAKGTSKGIISKGWTNNRFKNLTIGYTTICFSIEKNPCHASIDADLYRFESVSFCPNDHTHGIGLKVDNAQAWDLSMDGSNEISYCKYGIYWVSTNKQRTRQVSFSNMRFESGSMDYCVYMDLKGKTIDSVRFTNILCSDVDVCAFRLSGITNVIFDGCYMMLYKNNVAIQADARTKPILFLGTTINKEAAMNIAAPLVFEARTTGGGGFHYISYYDSDDMPVRFHTNVLKTMDALPYGPRISPDPNRANNFLIDVPDSKSFTILNPTKKEAGQEMTFIIKNSSGGNIGNMTFDSHYLLKDKSPLEKPGKAWKRGLLNYQLYLCGWHPLGAEIAACRK